MKSKIMSASKKAIHAMAKGGGLMGYMKGGDVTEPLIKAQTGNGEMKYPKSAVTQSDSTAYKTGYGHGLGLEGGGYAGVTANKHYAKGSKAAQNASPAVKAAAAKKMAAARKAAAARRAASKK